MKNLRMLLLLGCCFAPQGISQQVIGYERTDLVTTRDRIGRLYKGKREISLPSSGVIPHVAIGGLWKTILTVVNSHATKPLQMELSFWSNSGTRLGVTLSDGRTNTIGNVFTITLPPLGTLRLETVNTPSDVQTGWVDVDASSIHGTVFAVFRATIPNRPDYEALVTTEWSINDALVVPFDNRNGFGTAVAIANGWSFSPLEFAAEVYDQAGNKLDTYRERLAERSQAAFQTADRWAATRGRAGLIVLREISGWGVSALALLFNPSGAVTTAPAVELETY